MRVWIVVALLLVGCGARTGLAVDPADGASADAGVIVPRIARRTLSMSWSHACAIVEGEVSCWGDNSLSLVAEGAPVFTGPTRVPGLDDVVEVATGQIVSCALTSDGAVWCWGTTVGPGGPQRITVLPIAERLFAGSGTVCVITPSRTVACTGVPFLTGASCTSPATQPTFDGAVTVPVDDVVDLALGQRHACVVRGDASVWCWGCSEDGELGSLGAPASTTPVVVPGVSAIHVAAETHATCATAATGAVTCWGEGSQFGTSVTIRAVAPRAVSFGVAPIDLDVGVISSCAIGGGRVGCQGALLFGDCSDRRAMNRIVDLPSVREISIGYEDMCARDASGTVHCWGCNSTAASGDPSRMPHATPFALTL